MPSELLPNSTFSVMNKVMNNFKKQSKLRLIELDNENVIPTLFKKFKKPQILLGFFLVVTKNRYEVSYEVVMKFLRIKLHNKLGICV